MRAIGYDGYTLTVEVHSGRVYDHPGLPESVFHGLMNASSKGAFYKRHIAGGIGEA